MPESKPKPAVEESLLLIGRAFYERDCRSGLVERPIPWSDLSPNTRHTYKWQAHEFVEKMTEELNSSQD